MQPWLKRILARRTAGTIRTEKRVRLWQNCTRWRRDRKWGRLATVFSRRFQELNFSYFTWTSGKRKILTTSSLVTSTQVSMASYEMPFLEPRRFPQRAELYERNAHGTVTRHGLTHSSANHVHLSGTLKATNATSFKTPRSLVPSSG